MSYFALILSNMRSSQVEHSNTLVAWSEDEQKLHDLLKNERVAGGYRDDDTPGDQRWFKTFRKGGPLEWFNDFAWLAPTIQLLDTPEELAARARKARQELLRNTFHAE